MTAPASQPFATGMCVRLIYQLRIPARARPGGGGESHAGNVLMGRAWAHRRCVCPLRAWPPRPANQTRIVSALACHVGMAVCLVSGLAGLILESARCVWCAWRELGVLWEGWWNDATLCVRNWNILCTLCA
jgi:hypothetical protein